MDCLFLNVLLFVVENEEPVSLAAVWSKIVENRYLIFTVVSFIPLAYIFELIKYYIKNNKHVNDDTINLGQIVVQGELAKVLEPDQVALMLRSELAAIQECLDIIGSEKINSSPAQAASVDYYFFFSGIKDESEKEGTVTYQNTVIPVVKGLINKPKIQTNITLEFNSIKIPVSEIFRTIMAFVGFFPVPSRTRYNNSIIHISLITHKKYAKAVVYKSGSDKNDDNKNYSLSCSAPFNSIDEINNLLRDVAFMLLKLHNDKTFHNTHWKSMRYLVDGFVEFSRFRNSGLLEDRNKAKKLFNKALIEDPENNIEAMYYYAAMLMVERTTTAIEKAINYFNNALRTNDPKLKSFINLGLAFCYVQSYHRLGKTNKAMIEKANNAIKKVEDYWDIRNKSDAAKKQTDSTKNNLPLLPYMNGMIKFIEASDIKDLKVKEKILLEALDYSLKATQLDPYNSIFKNNVGWALMQLAISEIPEIPEEILLRAEVRTAMLGEQYFLEALILNPENKLTHANLALLYTIPYFKDQKNKNDLFFLKSRYHGLKAIKLDANYINAYRDLCITYIRYKKFDLAEEFFNKALEIAESPFKDAELFTEIIKEARENKMPEELLTRWSQPKPELFEPH